MKSTMKMLTLGLAVVGLAACTSGNATSYGESRTAGHMVGSEGKICSGEWRERALAAEEKLRRLEAKFNASMRK